MKWIFLEDILIKFPGNCVYYPIYSLRFYISLFKTEINLLFKRYNSSLCVCFAPLRAIYASVLFSEDKTSGEKDRT